MIDTVSRRLKPVSVRRRVVGRCTNALSVCLRAAGLVLHHVHLLEQAHASRLRDVRRRTAGELRGARRLPAGPGGDAAHSARGAGAAAVPTGNGSRVCFPPRRGSAPRNNVVALVMKAQKEERERNYLSLLAAEEQSLIPNATEADCPICLCPVEPGDGIVLRECLHVFCRSDAESHITHTR